MECTSLVVLTNMKNYDGNFVAEIIQLAPLGTDGPGWPLAVESMSSSSMQRMEAQNAGEGILGI
jgi:hypothetical protein